MCVLCFHQRGEALPLRLGGLWLEVCTFGRAHTPLQEAHRPPAISVSEMRQGLFQVRPPRSPYEETLMRLDDGMKAPLKKTKKCQQNPEQTCDLQFFKNHDLPSGRCQATRQAVVFTAKRALLPQDPCVSLEADPVSAHCTGDSTRPLSQGCKLLWKGPNWNLSYLTDKTWRTRCQQLLTGNVFLSGKPGATDKHLQRPSTSNMPI